MKYTSRIGPSIDDVKDEVLKAKIKYPDDFNSTHEGLAVLREEYLELEQEIFWGKKMHPTDHQQRIRIEAIQVAAMAIRIITELTTNDPR